MRQAPVPTAPPSSPIAPPPIRQEGPRHRQPAETALRLILLLIALTVVLGLTPSHVTGAPEPRVAVIAAPGLSSASLPDLVLVELSRTPGLTVVDRADLARVAAERSLADMTAPTNALARRQVGALLQATTLLLLAEVRVPSGPALRAIVADTATGVRLAVRHLPAPRNGAEGETAADLARFSRDALARFPKGPATLVAVPPFLNRALTHALDPWQARLAHLLEASLLQQPGVAVLELEEAEALRQELLLSPTGQAARPDPLFVRGEFTPVTRPDAPPQLSLSIELQDARRTLATIRHPGLAPALAPAWLHSDLMPQVLAAARPEGPAVSPSTFDPDAQFERLVARADDFARGGAHEPSTALREAALLLHPDDVPQHRLLIGEYDRLADAANRQTTSRTGTRADRADRPGESISARREIYLDLRRRQLDHFDQLVIQRRIPVADMEAILARTRPNLPSPWVSHGSPEQRAWNAELRERAFARLPHWVALTRQLPSRSQQVYLQQRLLTHETEPALWARPDDLEFLLALFQKLPDDIAPIPALAYFLGRPPADPSNPRETAEAPAFAAFLDQLQASPHPLARLQGRYGVLHREHLRLPRTAATNEVLLQSARQLQADLAAHWSAQKIPESERGPLDRLLKDIASRLERDLRPGEPSRVASSPVRREETNTGRLTFTPLALRWKTLDGQVRPWREPSARPGTHTGPKWPSRSGWQGVTGWTACGPGTDLLWSAGVVLLHRSQDLVEEVLASRDAVYEEVVWDGRQAWIGTRHDGVLLLNPDGTKAGHFGPAQELPPADRGLRLQVMGPGEAIAVGAFGPHARAWCARLRWSATETNVRVFHTATRVRGADTPFSGPGGTEPDRVFTPTWIHRLQVPGEPDRILVGRNADTSRGRWHPLSIRPDTLEVTTYPGELYEEHETASFASTPQGLIRCHRNGTVLLPPPGRTLPGGEAHRALCRPTGPDAPGGAGSIGTVLAVGGRLYVPGLIWFRLDPRTLEQEQLSPRRLPAPGRDLNKVAVSARHGLVGWSPFAGGIYRIGIDDAPKLDAPGL